MGLIPKLLGGTLKAGVGLAKGTAKTIGFASNVLGEVGEKAVTATGHLATGTIKGTGKASVNVGKKVGKALTRVPKEAMEDQTLYGRLVGRSLNAGGVAALTAGTMGISTINAMVDGVDNSKVAKLGYVSAGENLDRLVSYDGSGFMNRINDISGGDSEVMSDIVSNTFSEPNQFGANGSIVFALHNMREG